MPKATSSRAAPAQSTSSRPVSASTTQKDRRGSAQVRQAPRSKEMKGKKAAASGKENKGNRVVDEQEDEGVNEKKKGKRRRVDPEPEEQADEPKVSTDGAEGREEKRTKKSKRGPVVSFTRVVSKAYIKRTWKKLSRNGEAALKASLDDAAIELLATLQEKNRGDVQAVLQELFEEADEALSDLLVPPTAGRQGRKGEADLLTVDELHERIAQMEAALEPELAEVRTIKLALAREKKALEEDEERLSTFETKRQQVEKAEAKESSKNLHPLVADLLKSKTLKRPTLSLFDRNTPSNAWITESMNHKSRELNGSSSNDAEEEEEETESDEEIAPYDPAKDDYLIQVSAKLDHSLGEVERRLSGLARVERIVDEAEGGVVAILC
ncbi:hypothetical protein P7C70_g6797, partial [Phenoliferia sp. Uapishka_3]